MAESLLSVGLDVGTTTTQLILSRLQVENRAGGFAVPEMEITGRQIIYRGGVHFTPLVGEDRVDGKAIRQLVAAEYEAAGIQKSQVDTGAIIITGETSRKENAAAVLQALSGFAGDFVAATAGPHLESELAAKGSGAVEYSRQTGKTVLHLDIGGGTANLALIRQGEIVKTGCMNVGGRLIKLRPGGGVGYVSPVLKGLTELRPGDCPTPAQLESVARILTTALEMAAGLRPAGPLYHHLMTAEAGQDWVPPEEPCVISFSGGVADCIENSHRPGQFGDMGVELGQAIRQSRLCAGSFILGQETIRATVIGAGSHSARLSGSTVFYKDAALPKKNLPVLVFSRQEQESADLGEQIARRIRRQDGTSVVLAFPGYPNATYAQICDLAQKIAQAGQTEFLVCLESDMAKALGQRLQLLAPTASCLCIDRIRLTPGSYLDIGKPVGPALPVVVKTIILDGKTEL